MQTLTKLSKLDLSWNESLEELPQSITELHNLTVLNLSACDLRSLPDKYVATINYVLHRIFLCLYTTDFYILSPFQWFIICLCVYMFNF